MSRRLVFLTGVLVSNLACRRSGTRSEASKDGGLAKAPPSAAPSAVASSGSPAADASAPSARSADSKQEVWPTRFTGSGRGFVAQGDKALEGSAKSIVCDERSPCRVLWEKPAGRDEQRKALAVMAISLRATSRDPFNPARTTEDCEPIEYWLVRREKRGVVEVELLLEVCNDGYGSSGVGEDIIEVSDNRFYHQQSGGSAWRWSEREALQLSPRRVLEQGTSGFFSAGSNRWAQSWDWLKFSGNGEYFCAVCNDQGRAPDEPSGEPLTTWLPIPLVDVEPDFAASGWKQASLGACSARVAGNAETGFVVHGQQDGPDDASLRVVGLADDSFIIEIRDDHFVLAAKRLSFEDHLEVWTGQGDARAVNQPCLPNPPGEKPRQWGVRVADGAVWSGFGSPGVERLQAELGSREGSVRLRLRLLDAAPFVTFVYSDSDDGTSQKSLIATSGVKFGETRTLGETMRIDPKSATCRVRDGRLEPELY